MAERHPTTSTGRAVKLLRNGLVGGLVAWALAALGCVFGFGPAVAGAVLLAGAIAVAFFAMGQVIQVLFAEADAVQVLVVSLLSYAIRVGGLAAFAVLAARRLPATDGLALAIVVIAVVIGWLLAEIRAFRQLRIPAFDSSQGKTD